MAIIGKIRNKSGLLVGFIFVALALFVLSDFLSGKGGGGGQNPDDMIAGEVFGEEIKLMDYEQKVNEAIEMAKQNQGPMYNDEMADRIREDVWNREVNKIIFEKELSHFNTAIPSAELNDLLYGNNIPEYITGTAMFKNAMGQFSVDSVIMWRRRIEQNAQSKQWWVDNIENPVKETRKINKYFNLISKGMYVTKAEAQRDNVDQNRKFKIRYVAQQFISIPDSTIKVSDEEIREYYNKNKQRKKFEAFGSRSFSYVEFLLMPTDADFAYAKQQAEGLYERFKEAKNDSAFVMANAETKMFNDQYSAPGTYPASVDSLIQKADSGSIVGPFQDGDTWKIVKVRGTKFEEQAKVKHILIAYVGAERSPATRSKEDAKKLADSLLNVIKKGTPLDDLVMQYSDDGGKTSNAGIYDWFSKDVGFTQKFKDFAFAAKNNDLKVVETEFGFHVMQSMGQRSHKLVKAATVDLKVRPMKETDMAVRAKAVDFYTSIKESSQFQEAAQKMKLVVQTREIAYNQATIDGTQGTRQLASWVQKGNEGDITDVPVLVKGTDPSRMRQPDPTAKYDRWVIARLDNIKQKGVPEFDDVKEMMKLEVLRAKKGEIQAKQMKGFKSLEELAAKLNTKVRETEISFSSASFPDLPEAGTEYSVIGSVFSMQKPGDMSVPLKGKNGVYVVMLSGITEATPLANVEETRKNMTNIIRGNAQSGAYSALRELAKIEDSRLRF